MNSHHFMRIHKTTRIDKDTPRDRACPRVFFEGKHHHSRFRHDPSITKYHSCERPERISINDQSIQNKSKFRTHDALPCEFQNLPRFIRFISHFPFITIFCNKDIGGGYWGILMNPYPIITNQRFFALKRQNIIITIFCNSKIHTTYAL